MQRPAARGIDLWHTAIPVALVTLTGAHPSRVASRGSVTGVLESVHCDPLSHASYFIERLPYGFSCKLVSPVRAPGADTRQPQPATGCSLAIGHPIEHD